MPDDASRPSARLRWTLRLATASMSLFGAAVLFAGVSYALRPVGGVPQGVLAGLDFAALGTFILTSICLFASCVLFAVELAAVRRQRPSGPVAPRGNQIP